MSNIPLHSLLKPFSISIFAKVSALREFEASTFLTQAQRARLKESISDDIKKCTNFVKPKVSKSAKREALKIGVDLSQMNWHDQGRFDRGRSMFHWEHMVPVKSIREKCRQASSEEQVLEILMTAPCVVWILKSEDTILTQLGFRSNRDNPEAAYLKAGIELCELNNPLT
jgi:hypothetical protein